MYEEIFQSVAGETRPSSRARVTGWRRCALTQRNYPGAYETGQPQHSIEGILWLAVSARGLAALDEFEGSDYRRMPVMTFTVDQQTVMAQIYAFQRPDLVLNLDWSPILFEKHYRQNFIQQQHF